MNATRARLVLIARARRCWACDRMNPPGTAMILTPVVGAKRNVTLEYFCPLCFELAND